MAHYFQNTRPATLHLVPSRPSVIVFLLFQNRISVFIAAMKFVMSSSFSWAFLFINLIMRMSCSKDWNSKPLSLDEFSKYLTIAGSVIISLIVLPQNSSEFLLLVFVMISWHFHSIIWGLLSDPGCKPIRLSVLSWLLGSCHPFSPVPTPFITIFCSLSL